MEGRTSASGDRLTASVHVAELVGNFVTLADTLSEDFEIERHLEALVGACVQTLPVTAAAVLMVDARGVPSVAVATNGDVDALERLQLLHDHGPGLDCLRDGGAPVTVRLSEHERQWPAYVREARAAGFESAHAIPLRQSEEMLGALDLYDPDPRPLVPEHQQVAEALARVATIGLVHHRARIVQERRADQLQRALTSRVAIEQAKGVLSERAQIGSEEAFRLLRAYARQSREPLSEVAAAVVERRLPADTVLKASRPPE